MNNNITPSAGEFTGYYNVPEPKKGRKRNRSYLHTVNPPPALRLEEATKMAKAVLEVVCSYANQYNFSPDELRNYYWGSTSCVHMDDRTFHLLLDPKDYTLVLINQLQMLLLLEYTLWRIRIAGSTNATTIMIYPSDVRYGSLSDDPEEALSNIVKSLLADEPRSRQIAKAHLETVKHLAGVALRLDFSEPVKILVGFDNYEGDFTKVTMWTLSKNETPDLLLPATVEFMVANKYYGKMNGDFGPQVTDDAPFWIREWIFPGRELPKHLQFIVSDANYQTTTLEMDVNPVQFVEETPR